MSRIAEQKALEAYPEIEGTETYFDRDCICTKPIDLNRQKRIGYINGYDQAMQDFLEKACDYLNQEFTDMWLRYLRGHSFDDEIKMFKNYIQDESEN